MCSQLSGIAGLFAAAFRVSRRNEITELLSRLNWSRIVGDSDKELGELLRSLMRELYAELTDLDARIRSSDLRLREIFRNSEQCQRLGAIEGIGPVTPTVMVSAVGDRSSFSHGRQFAAWLGLVPKQRSSGGRQRLFGISNEAIGIYAHY